MKETKSFNIISAELLDMVKSGWGIHQACRKLEINKSELLICLNKNKNLADFCKERFKITPDGTGIKTDSDESELAKLRARAEELGLKPHSQIGLKKLKKLIDEAEANINEEENDKENVNDTETPQEMSENQETESED